MVGTSTVCGGGVVHVERERKSVSIICLLLVCSAGQVLIGRYEYCASQAFPVLNCKETVPLLFMCQKGHSTSPTMQHSE